VHRLRGLRGCMPHGALTLTEAGIVTDRSLCRTCGRCAEVLPTLAMEMSGSEYSIDEVMREIEKETVFRDRVGGRSLPSWAGETVRCRYVRSVRLVRPCVVLRLAVGRLGNSESVVG